MLTTGNHDARLQQARRLMETNSFVRRSLVLAASAAAGALSPYTRAVQALSAAQIGAEP